VLAHGRWHELCKSVRTTSEPLFHGGASPQGSLGRSLALMPSLQHAADEQDMQVRGPLSRAAGRLTVMT